jgi:O-antigen ligase
MELKNLISIFTALAFLVFILFGKEVKRNYLLFVLFSFPLVDLFITPVSMGGFKVFDFLTATTLILSIKKPEGSLISSWYTVSILTLVSILILGCLASEFPVPSFVSLIQMVSVLAYSKILIDECVRDPKFIALTIRALKLSCMLSLVFLALQLIFGLGVTLYELNPNASKYDGLIRYPSFFQDPQKYGQFLAVSSFLFLIDASNKNTYIKSLAVFVIIIGALFSTGVRAAFSGLCAGLFLVFLFGNVRYRIAGIACLIAGAVIIIFYGDMFAMFNRGSNVNDTAEVRFAYWNAAIDIFKAHPLFGIGIGNYQQYVSYHAQDQVWEYFGTIEYMDHPESGYLKLLVELGFVCFLIILSFLIIPLVKATKAILLYKDNKTILLITAAILSWMVAFITVYSFSDVRIFLLVTTLLCLIAASYRESERKNTSYAHYPLS